MLSSISRNNPSEYKAYVITGPTSGIGLSTALELAKHGAVVLVGRDKGKLDEVQQAIERKGGNAVAVVCDLSDLASVRRAAAEIVAHHLPIVGLLNNAGIFPMRATSSRGEWAPGGSKMPGADAYATSKQCTLATALAFARETPRLHFNAVEPGFIPETGLGRDANVFLRFLARYVLSLLAPHIKYWSTPKLAAPMIVKVLLNEPGVTGVYYDEKGHPMLGSALVRDPTFQDRVVAETRVLLSGSQFERRLDSSSAF